MIDLSSLIEPSKAAGGIYILFILFEMIYASRKGSVRYEAKDTVTSILMGLGSTVVAGIVGGGLYLIAMWVWHNYRITDLGSPIWVFLVAFIAYDFVYYWLHRFGHTIRWMWAAHVIHHSSQHYNLSTALRQTWTSFLTPGFIFSLPMVVLGIHPMIIIFVTGLNLIYQFWFHTEAIDKMHPWFEAIMNTPSHHRVHHATNPKYLDRNHAGVFIIWDKLFGTFEPEDDEKPIYGLINNVGTFNPLKIATHEWVSILKDWIKADSWLDRVKYLVMAPGWSPDGSRKTSKMLRQEWEKEQYQKNIETKAAE